MEEAVHMVAHAGEPAGSVGGGKGAGAFGHGGWCVEEGIHRD